MKRLLTLSTLALAVVASPALAQTAPASARKTAPSLQVFGAWDSLSIASSKTWDTVFGKSTMSAPGGGADVTGLWKGLFIRGELSSSEITGQRVVIISGTTYKLGTALTVKMTPKELGLGWRFQNRSRFTPFLGASAVFLGYTETSDHADSLENTSETLTGAGGFAGVDVRITRQIFAGGEVHYRSVNASPSATSVAGTYGEKNLGGLVYRVKLGVRF